MSYRPITDVWILARPKVKYYGAYPNGFLERANALLGIAEYNAVLHLCGGRVKDYPNRRCVHSARTADSDPNVAPDFLVDLTDVDAAKAVLQSDDTPLAGWPAVLIDPPYTPEDHAKYGAGGKAMPTANGLLRLGLELVRPGGRVGVLHYVWPQPPKTARSIACIGVVAGFNNRMRCFSVFERIAAPVGAAAGQGREGVR